MSRVFGEVPGIPPGSMFVDRKALHAAGIHCPTQHGISGSQTEGADSIVVSGGYEDDEDYGDVVVYTGAGGNDPGTRRQIADQELSGPNLALAINATEGLPVRVVRGRRGDPKYAPSTGYRYDGLYRVEDFWEERGRSGFKVIRYRLVKQEQDPVAAISQTHLEAGAPPAEPGPAPRIDVRVQRIVRNTSITQRVKELHRHGCQVCGIVVATPAGPYAEGAHIRPLGRPHDGPDIEANVLCLCPTDRVRLDYGSLVIDDDLTVRDSLAGTVIGPLRRVPGHKPGVEFLRYHRQMRSFT